MQKFGAYDNEFSFQIGCTYTATYALVDGVLYGWGLNNNGRLGVDCKSHDGVMILKPSVINCGGGRRWVHCDIALVLIPGK